jgi:hypothetical protein
MDSFFIDNGQDPDALGRTRNTGPQAAHTSYYKVDVRSRLTGKVKFFDDRWID